MKNEKFIRFLVLQGDDMHVWLPIIKFLYNLV